MSKDFVTLGMFIIDEFSVLDDNGSSLGIDVRPQVGSSVIKRIPLMFIRLEGVVNVHAKAGSKGEPLCNNPTR